MLLRVGCIAGALDESEYVWKLAAAGFGDILIEPTREYNVEDARHFLTEAGVDVDVIGPEVMWKVLQRLHPRKQALVRTCCGPSCCS